ncbi:MAG: SH3 domain-containing protein [Bacteroidota bacterium]
MMQDILKKNIYFYALFLFPLFTLAQTPAQEQNFAIADSLFQTGKYTDAFTIYEKLVHEEEVFSPQMLLKMAYVKEGIKEYPAALYYLNLYYRYSPQLEVLEKMERIAEEQVYEGYQYGDQQYFETLRGQYREILTLGFVVVAFLWLAFLVFQKVKQKPILGGSIGLLVWLVVALLWVNLSLQSRLGILQKDQAYLMDSPSAGGKPLGVLDAGHRLPILDKEDIWYKIEWEGQTGYIREHNVWVVE